MRNTNTFQPGNIDDETYRFLASVYGITREEADRAFALERLKVARLNTPAPSLKHRERFIDQ